MIPQFDSQGFLPQGLHDTSIQEIRSALGFTPQRSRLIDGLDRFVHVWNESGFVDYAVIDGSFVTSKPEPGDIDMLLIPIDGAFLSVNFMDLSLSYADDRDFTKAEFGCEAFVVYGGGGDNLREWIRFFSHDRQGNVRGLLRLEFPL